LEEENKFGRDSTKQEAIQPTETGRIDPTGPRGWKSAFITIIEDVNSPEDRVTNDYINSRHFLLENNQTLLGRESRKSQDLFELKATIQKKKSSPHALHSSGRL